MKLKLFFILFYISVSISFAQQSDFKHINFKKADSIASLYKNEKLTNLPLLSYKLTYRLDTDVEKFRAIYVWVCNNISSDYSLTTKILNKGKKYRNNRAVFLEWNETLMPKFLKRLLEDKKTMCTGYAFIVKELSRLSNIECEIINGYNKSPDYDFEKPFVNHSWNSVKLNNKWYLCDPILASGYFFIDTNQFIFNYNDGFFLTDPNLFIKSHYPEDKKWTLTNTKQTFKNFIDFPIIYSHTYEHKITPILPNQLNTEVAINENVPFEFYIDTDLDIEKISLVQSNGWKNIEIPIEAYSYKEGVLKFQHHFSKKGLYDVHIKISNNIVASYTLKVLKNTIKLL